MSYFLPAFEAADSWSFKMVKEFSVLFKHPTKRICLFCKEFPKPPRITRSKSETTDMKNVLIAVNKEIAAFLSAFHMRVLSFGGASTGLLQCLAKEREADFQELLKSYTDSSNSYNEISTKYLENIDSFFDIINTFNTQILVDPHCDQINPLFKEIMKKRTNYSKMRENVITLISPVQEEMQNSHAKVNALLNNRIQSLVSLLSLYVDYIHEYATLFENLSSSMNESIKCLEYPKEIKSYSSDKSLMRYDMRFKQFKAIEMDKELAVSPRREINIYPNAVASVLASFKGSGNNEISVDSGKIVFLLEPPKNGWALIATSLTSEPGFIPEKYLSIIGHATAICRAKVSCFKVGDVVGVKKKDKLKNQYLVEVNGIEQWVDINNFGLIAGKI